MRTFLLFFATAVGCFAAGLMTVRGWNDDDSGANAAQPVARDDVKAPALAAIDAKEEKGTSAVLALAEKPADLARDHAAYAALMRMDGKEFAAGASEFLTRLKRMESGNDAATFGGAWMDRWLEVDRESALQFIQTSKAFEELGADGGSGWDALARGSSKLGGAFRALARREIEWTGEYLKSLKAEPKRDLAIFEFLQVVARRDPGNARRYLERFSEGVNRVAALQGYVMGLATVDTRAAFDLALHEPAGPLRLELLESTIRNAEIGNVREMLDRIEDPDLRQQLAYEALYGMWYRSRPDTAECIKEETARLAKAKGKARDASFWATAINQSAEVANIPQIVEWAAAENSEAHRKVFTSLAGKWAGTDPAAARRWLTENAVRLDARSVEEMRDVFENLAFVDLAGTKQWVDTLPAGPLQDRARFQLALDSGAKGDLAQVQTVYASILPRDSEGKMAKQVGAMLAKRDGTAAADWAMRLPGGAARAMAIESVAAEWTKHDLPGVRTWLETMPDGAERDTTMKEYAAKVGYNDPQTGAACVEQIADAGTREKAASHVYFSWRNEDPAGSRAWVQNLGGVSEKWRANLLNQPK